MTRGRAALLPALGLGALVTLLVVALPAARRHGVDQARQAVQEERRRVARVLHDGLVQDVSLLAGQMRLWAQGRPGLDPGLLAEAAQRAVDESRAVIAALDGTADEPLDRALLRMADDVESRIDVHVRTDVETVPALPLSARAALLRAARDVVLDAARSGGCRDVDVVLRGGDQVRLTVLEGVPGAEADAAGAESRLEAVRGRLQAVGARLVVASGPGRGLSVEMALPCRL